MGVGVMLGAICANSVFWRFGILSFNHNRSESTRLKKICSIKVVLFFLIKTHFACLQTVFNYFWNFSVFLLLLFHVGQFDIYWYILEAWGFCRFMPIFIVGWGGYPGGGLCPTLAFQRGWTVGSFLPSPTPFLLSTTPLLPSPTTCFLSHSLALLLSPSNLLLSPTPSLLSPIHSLLSPTPTSPLLPQPCPLLHSCKKICLCESSQEELFFFLFFLFFFFANSPVPLWKVIPLWIKLLFQRKNIISTFLFLLIINTLQETWLEFLWCQERL